MYVSVPIANEVRGVVGARFTEMGGACETHAAAYEKHAAAYEKHASATRALQSRTAHSYLFCLAFNHITSVPCYATCWSIDACTRIP